MEISRKIKQKVHMYVCKKYHIWMFCPYYVKKDNVDYYVMGFRKGNLISPITITYKENSSSAYYIRLTTDGKIDQYSITSIDILGQIIKESKRYYININGSAFPKCTTWESLAIEADLNP